MERIKRHWWNIPRSVRKPIVLIAGTLALVAGAIMWVIPGPGWATVFLGLAILSTEFEWAKRLKDYLIARFKGAAQAIKKRSKR